MPINLEKIQEIKKTFDNIDIVAATKYATVEDLYELEKAGINIFGENRVQAFLDKYEQYQGEADWHIIGTLQTNKVKYVVDKVKMIHSVNTISLIDEIEKQSFKHGVIMPILLQVNIAKEETKHGFNEEEVESVIEYIVSNCKNIEFRGFMMMAPKGEMDEIRIFFKKMKSLYDVYANKFPNEKIDTLSMGMSGDYNVAIEEGSTMIRIGRVLFK